MQDLDFVHPWQVRTSQDVKGHLGPGTMDMSLEGQVRTSKDIPGCEGTFGTWDYGHVLGGTG